MAKPSLTNLREAMSDLSALHEHVGAMSADLNIDLSWIECELSAAFNRLEAAYVGWGGINPPAPPKQLQHPNQPF